MSVFDDPNTIVTSFGWYKKGEAIPVLTCVEKLRKCSRCDHFPCPCCVNWCDTVSSWQLGDDDGPVRCACEEDMECVFSEEDQVMNHVICTWMRKEIERLGAVSCTEDAEGHIVILIPVPLAADRGDRDRGCAGARLRSTGRASVQPTGRRMKRIEFSKPLYERAVAFVTGSGRHLDKAGVRSVRDLFLGDMALNERCGNIGSGGFMVYVENHSGDVLKDGPATHAVMALDPAMGILGIWVFDEKGE